MNNCLECGQPTENPKFCSRTCSTTHNNRKFPKHGDGHGNECSTCGRKKSWSSRICRACGKEETFQRQLDRTLADVMLANKNKWATVRTNARQILAREGREKKCQICGFDLCVEVAHQRAISTFPSTALLREVNHPNNLAYFCPNHHTLWDRSIKTVQDGLWKAMWGGRGVDYLVEIGLEKQRAVEVLDQILGR